MNTRIKREQEVNGRRQWQPTPVLLPEESHGRRSLVGCSPWGHEESDTIERLHFHFSLSCIREGNGNPLQCSCLENPRDGGSWWAAVYGVTESDTTEATQLQQQQQQHALFLNKVRIYHFTIYPFQILYICLIINWSLKIPFLKQKYQSFVICIAKPFPILLFDF